MKINFSIQTSDTEYNVVGYIIFSKINDKFLKNKDLPNIFFKENTIEIEKIEVFDEYKKLGYGKYIMNESLKYIKELGFESVVVSSYPFGFRGLKFYDLIEFYKKFGFVEYKNNIMYLIPK
jgi:ribosomal protein S18 acetylase RimI-like enzyme